LSWRTVAGSATLLAAVLLVYLPALHGGLIWNDADYVTRPALRSLQGLGRIWFELGATEQYYPLLHSFFWLQHALWGDATVGYHLVGILLHAAAALLFVAVLLRLSARGAWLAGFIFALHPVCVESVAWISEQKNTLSLVFYLSAGWCYLRFDADRRTNDFVLASACFLLALLCKTTVATLPAALLVVLWWRRGRLEWRRDVLPLLPWFAVGVGWGLFSAWVEKHYVGAQGDEFILSFVGRLLLAGRVVWFYVGKLAWPVDLIFIYPRWDMTAQRGIQTLFLAAALALLGLAWALRRRTRGLLASALFFGGSLFPVMGFFNVYGFIYSYVADHWQYLPSLGLIAGFALTLTRLLAPLPSVVQRGVPLVLLATLGLLTWRQSHLYTDIETFYKTTLAQNAECWMAHNNLGNLLRDTGRGSDAIFHFNETLRLKPNSPKAHNNLGNVYRDRREPAQARAFYARAVELAPDVADYRNNLATALREIGDPQGALAHHARALELFPESASARNNYGVTLRDLGHPAEAAAQFEVAVRLDPTSSPAHLNLALSYSLTGRNREAQEHYSEARKLNPALPDLKLP